MGVGLPALRGPSRASCAPWAPCSCGLPALSGLFALCGSSPFTGWSRSAIYWGFTFVAMYPEA